MEKIEVEIPEKEYLVALLENDEHSLTRDLGAAIVQNRHKDVAALRVALYRCRLLKFKLYPEKFEKPKA